MTAMVKDQPIRRNSSTHVMLMILKFYNKPTTFEEMYEISPKKITVNNRRRCTKTLIDRGYAVELNDDTEPRFMITAAGINAVYDLVEKKKRYR